MKKNDEQGTLLQFIMARVNELASLEDHKNSGNELVLKLAEEIISHPRAEPISLAYMTAFFAVQNSLLKVVEKHNKGLIENYRETLVLIQPALPEFEKFKVSQEEAKAKRVKAAKQSRKNKPAGYLQPDIKEYWERWHAQPTIYKGYAEFEKDMIEKYPEAAEFGKNTIYNWCKRWEKEGKK